MPLVVLIPALNPTDQLIMVVESLVAHQSITQIIVVNDGSDTSFDVTFQKTTTSPKVKLLQHPTNLGKGAALRTGINYFLGHATPNAILVTADADGQHLPEDIIAVGLHAQNNPCSLILGTRVFGEAVPCRSKFGNNITRWVFRLVIGKKISDTQTGLRVIPSCLMPQLLKIKARGYAFELEMLILAARNGVRIQSLPIQTVYLHGNQSSHFKPVLDSVRIYLVFTRFIAPLILSLILDITLFALIWQFSHHLLLCTVASRFTASIVSYFLNTRLIVQSPSSKRRSIIQYAATVALLSVTSFFLIQFLMDHRQWNAITAKFIVESLLLIISYGVQRNIQFAHSSDKITGALLHKTASVDP